jgi:hypothetical protein
MNGSLEERAPRGGLVVQELAEPLMALQRVAPHTRGH